MKKADDFTVCVDVDEFSQDVTRVEDLSDRVRLAGYGLASPLVEARAAQMQREVTRTALRKGANHPEVALRQANADRAATRFTLFNEELGRAHISRPEFDTEKGTSLWGRVVDGGLPQADLSVSAIGDGMRLDFACSDALGSFALQLPENTPFVLSVKNKAGAELYRDPESETLEAGQQQYREIDLSRGAETPCPEPDPDVPPDETFKMLDLVGRNESAALSLLANLGLKVGQRSTQPAEDMIGRIISHDPEAGAVVKRGDFVNIVVGESTQVQVPDLIGLTMERAQELLKKAGLAVGEIIQVPVRKERAGLIVEQAPLPGTLIDPGSAVKMSVGVAEDEEPELVAVPDVSGKSIDEADAILKEAGLKRGGTSETPVPSAHVGLVVAQSPGAGAMVVPESSVELVVGKLAEDNNQISVPDLRGKPRGDAIAILQAAKLEVGEVSEKSTDEVPAGTVLDQAPPPGSLAQPGDAVKLIIAAPVIVEIPRAQIPQVTGTPFEQAAASVKEAGFNVNRAARAVEASAQVGIVLAQRPRAGSLAQTGTTVTLVVGEATQTPGRVEGDRNVLRIAELTQTELVDRRVLPTNEPKGSFAQRLDKAGIKTVDDVDKLLSMNRRELRSVLGLRTLAQTDQAIRALKRERNKVIG